MTCAGLSSKVNTSPQKNVNRPRSSAHGNGRRLGTLIRAPVMIAPLTLAHWNDGPRYLLPECWGRFVPVA
jgi:hypothetical protein